LGIGAAIEGATLTTTIGLVTAQTGTEAVYAEELGELWTDLRRTLTRLDGVAADPERLDETDATVVLRRLQYALHVSFEHVAGLTPPPGGETAHAELGAALAGARDATAEVAEAASLYGAVGVEPLVHEWRGALFRVRLARLRLAPRQAPRPVAAADQPDGFGRPLIAFLLALLGAVAFVAGAATGLWPVWGAGLIAVCGSVFAFRP
jgi:hypothetical protein